MLLSPTLSQALTDSVNVLGTAPFLANQPMGGSKFTGLGAGAAAADSANLGQVQSDTVAHRDRSWRNRRCHNGDILAGLRGLCCQDAFPVHGWGR